MDAALQKRTGLGLLVLMIGHVVAFLLPQISSALAASLRQPSVAPTSVIQTIWIAGAISSVVIVSIWVVGAVLLLQRLGGYAQAALACFGVYAGFDVLRVAVSVGATSSGASMASIGIRTAIFGLVASVLHVLNSVSMLLLLRRAAELAGARPSNVATGIVIACSCWSLLRNVATALLARTMAISAIQYVNYLGVLLYALLCGSFVWMAFRARKATLGLLLNPTVSAQDAYRGPTAMR